jgi:DNA replication protein DnaC
VNYTKSESLQSIEQTMKTLKLSGLAKEWRSVTYHDSEQYMREMLDIEIREREANRMARMVKQAGFRVIKTLDNFVWKPTIEIPASITREEIERVDFVGRKENLVLMGAVGTGKTHLASAIALSLCEKGRHVRFFTAPALANILQEKHQKGMLTDFIQYQQFYPAQGVHKSGQHTFLVLLWQNICEGGGGEKADMTPFFTKA